MKRITEKDILLDLNGFWVLDTHKSYAVMMTGITHSVSDSEYHHNEDGLACAIARCNYLKNRFVFPPYYIEQEKLIESEILKRMEVA